MLAFALSLAAAAPPQPALPAEEERLERESLEQLQLASMEKLVPAWPVMRPFRRPARDATLVGLAIGAVGGVLVASLVPDRGLVYDSSCGGGQTLIHCL